jgi:hypothetical protein
MSGGKHFIFFILMTVLLATLSLPINSSTTSSQLIHPCSCRASFLESGSRWWFICPENDGQTLASGNNKILVFVSDAFGTGIGNILASDFWLIGCDDLCLVAGSGSIDADSATNEHGYTTISGTMAAGGCDFDGVNVVVAGLYIGCPRICLSMHIISSDLDCDGDVDLVDLSIFAPAFNSNTGSPNYDPCCDYNWDGNIGLVDFSMFAQHWQHHG